MDYMYTTTHSKNQAKKRFGWDENKLLKKTKEAWESGDEIDPQWSSIYFHRVVEVESVGTIIYLSEGKIFIFDIKKKIPKLITIFNAKKNIH